MARTLTIEFPNNSQIPKITDGILEGSASVERSLCTSSSLVFGELNSALFKISLQNVDDITGQEISVSSIEDDSSTYNIFYGIVDSAKVQKTGIYRDIIAYDLLYTKKNIDVGSWYNNLFSDDTSRISLGTFRQKLFEHIGLKVQSTELPFDNIIIGKTIESTSITAEVFLNALCELNGVFLVMIGDTANFVSLEEETLNITENVKTTSTYEDFSTLGITGVRITDNSENLGVIAGNGDNLYTMVGNVFTTDLTSNTNLEIATTLLSKLSQIVYTPMNLELILPNFDLTLGKKIKYNDVVGYILTQSISGTGMYTETISCSGESTQRSSDMEPNELVKLLNRNYIRIKAEQDEFNVLIHGENGIESQIQQLSNQIVLKVDSNGKLVEVALIDEAEKGTKFMVSATNIELTAEEAISFMANGTIDLSSKNIYIKADNFSIDKDTGFYLTNGSTYVSLNPSGDNIQEIGLLQNPFSYTLEDTQISNLVNDSSLSKPRIINEMVYAQSPDEKLYYLDMDTNKWVLDDTAYSGILFSYKNNSDNLEYYELTTQQDSESDEYYLYLKKYDNLNGKNLIATIKLDSVSSYSTSVCFLCTDKLFVWNSNNFLYEIDFDSFSVKNKTEIFQTITDDPEKPWEYYSIGYQPLTPSDIYYFDENIYFLGKYTDADTSLPKPYIVEYVVESGEFNNLFELTDDGSAGLLYKINNQIHIFGLYSMYSGGSYTDEKYHLIYDTENNEIVKNTDMPGLLYGDSSIVFTENNSIFFSSYSSNTTMDTFYKITNTADESDSKKIFSVTNKGDASFYGDVYATSLTLGQGVTLDTSSVSGLDDELDDLKNKNYVLTDAGLGDETEGTYFKVSKDGLLKANNAIIEGTLYADVGRVGGWIIYSDYLGTPDYSNADVTSGLKLQRDGNIYSKGTHFIPDGSFANLYSGKWIFGFGSGSDFDTSKGYVDISVEGIYAASKKTQESASRYLFRVDTNTDIVKVESSGEFPALSVSNNGTGTCLEVVNNASTYDNKCASFGVTVMNKNNELEKGYLTLFGEGVEGSAGRVILRPDQNIKSSSTENPANYTNSACGTLYYPWGTMSCLQLYVNKQSVTSDRKLKEDIKEIDEQTALSIIKGLVAHEYYMKDSNNKRVHMGFYAQEVKKHISDLDIGDMAIYEAVTKKDGDDREYYFDDTVDDEHLRWSLNYNEFIAPIVKTLQYLIKENELKTKKIEELEKIIKGI